MLKLTIKIEDYQINNDYNTIGEAVDAIIAEHRELSKSDWGLNYITNVVNRKLVRVYMQKLKKQC